ncbi:S8 family serine peptidase [Sphaerisporangium sp. B11E5]|uniref:S8 family peptidase n=1 Tax=Sphaerisporangium sp. B11E5 TaxID=3153563 RepID=UPI00325E38A2
MRLRSLLAGTAVLAVTATAAPAVAAPAHASAAPVVAENLAAEVVSGKKARAIVEVRGYVARVAETLEAASGETTVIDKTSSGDFLVATIDQPTLAAAVADPMVKAVYKDELSKPALNVSTKLIGSKRANRAGWTGRGSTIAILDTGIDRDHPFFAGRIVREACFSTSDPDPLYQAHSLCPNGEPSQVGEGAADAETAKCVVDGVVRCSHGTHVAGVAAGKRAGDVRFDGVAPEAGILPVQVYSRFDGPVCAEQGTSAPCFLSFTSDQKLALQYVDQVHAGLNVVAVNLSFSVGPKHTAPCDQDPAYGALKWEILWLKDFGVTTVAASGNDRHRDGVASPACLSSVVAVGATGDDDRPAAFGNRGPLLDLLAPGVAVRSAVPGGVYRARSGTSVAAAHVAGALALVRQANQDLPGEGLVEKLRTTGKSVAYRSGGTTVTTKRIDLVAALSLRPTATPHEHVDQ